MAIVIRRLGEDDEVENFDCGDDALNNYLKRHAWTNPQRISIGVSYVAADENAPLLCLATLLWRWPACRAMRFLRNMSAGCLLTICL